jgi:hypothetical protein
MTVDRGGAPGRAKVMERFANVPVQVKAGTYDVAVTFIERARIESDEFVGFLPGDEFSRGDRMPRLVDGVQVVGPFSSPGVSETVSRRRIFICRPGKPNEELPCARRISENLARRAFRRPVRLKRSIRSCRNSKWPKGCLARRSRQAKAGLILASSRSLPPCSSARSFCIAASRRQGMQRTARLR